MARLMLALIICYAPLATTAFYPDVNNYDAYGQKIAVNDILFAQAKNQDQTFLVQFAPYNNTKGSLQCIIPFDDAAHYVYSVGVGSKVESENDAYFYYYGEVLSQASSSSVDQLGRAGAFIGVMINSDPLSAQSYLASGQPINCGSFQAHGLKFISSYEHQEYLVVAVEPHGKYAIGLATDFVFRYQPFPNSTMRSQNSSTVWPNSVTFQPCAADVSLSFTIAAGFVRNSVQSRVRATPTVYLLWNNNLTVLASWSYSAANNSWQSRLTYSSVDTWSTELTMSVKINSDDPTRVLVGMPFLNTVFLFQVSKDGTNLTMVSSVSYSNSLGFGKSVTWLTSTQAAVLYSAYSSDSTSWASSTIYVYTSLNGTSLSSVPTAVIPNAQQPLPSTINGKFLRLVSSPTTVAILDAVGGTMLILSEAPGLFASTDISKGTLAASMPVVSHSAQCIGGMFKADSGIHSCVPCPVGYRNPGDSPVTTCIKCSANAFCPLGAVYDMNNATVSSISQAVAYPRSPDLTVYEDLLIVNMITFGSTPHCLRVSPLFWTSVLLLIAAVMLMVMASLNFCVQEPRRTEWRTTVKNIFLRTDLVVRAPTLGRIFCIAVIF